VHDGDAAAMQVADAGAEHSLGDDHQDLPNAPASHPVPHTDHCSHAHGLAVGAANDSDSRLTVAHDCVDSPSDNLVSVSIQPHQRPPIA
jgi:hypothetical protein